MEIFENLLALCHGKTVFIQTHNFPDPDAIGSAFGLQKLLAGYGVPSTLCYDGAIDKLSTRKMVESLNIRMFSYGELSMSPEDFIICVDSQKHAGNITDFIGKEIACIDHHPTFHPAEYLYKDVRTTGACATLIAGYYEGLGKIPDADTATALLYGLKIDTLQFTRGVTGQDIEAFSFLFPYCDKAKLLDLERNNMEFQDLKAFGAAVKNVQVYGVTAIACIPFACPDAQTAILSDFLLSLQEVEVAVVYSCRADGIKFSVRSERPDIHAGNLIYHALGGVGNGGGHAEMAGGFIGKDKLPLLGDPAGDEICRRFLARIDDRNAFAGTH